MSNYTVCLCDDNSVILKEYEILLHQIARKHNISVCTYLFSSAEQLLFRAQDVASFPDIIYLDILLGKINGIELARKLRKMGCDSQIIFLTCSADYVFDSFDISPFYYILKSNTSRKKFEEIFLHALEKVSRISDELFVLKQHHNASKLPLNSILYFNTSNGNLNIHCTDRNIYSCRRTITETEKQLRTKGFARSHRSYLVNLSHIQSIQNHSVLLSDNTCLPIGSRFENEFRNRFHDFLMDTL